MRIRTKISGAFVCIALLVAVVGYTSLNVSKTALRRSIGNQSALLAQRTLDYIDQHSISARIDTIQAYSTDSTLQRTLAESNQRFERLGNVQEYMDEQDRIRTSMILEKNHTNQASSWKNPDSGNNYTVTPIKTYEVADGPCREFTLDANIGGKTQESYGTACRQQDGSWKMIQ